MKPVPKNDTPAPKRPVQKTLGPAAQLPRRRVRKLFQIEAKPLDNTATAGAAVRALRRARPWLAVAFTLFTPAVLFPAQDVETNAPAGLELPVPAVQPSQENAAELPPVQLDQETISAIATNVAAALAAQRGAGTNVQGRPSAETPRSTEGVQRQPNAPGLAQNRRDERGRDSGSRSPDRSGRDQRSSAAYAPAPAPSSSQDFSAYRIITERNIFDPNRSARRSNNNNSRPRPKAVDSFALVGIMSYEKGTFAFFDGSRSEFKKAVKESGDIAGFKVASIEPDEVRLSSGDRQFELQVGTQLRREEEGPWEKSTQAASYPSGAPAVGAVAPSSGSGATPAQVSPPSSGGSADEVLKRLMQRREQE